MDILQRIPKPTPYSIAQKANSMLNRARTADTIDAFAAFGKAATAKIEISNQSSKVFQVNRHKQDDEPSR